ncbi:uncharacterized protein LOC118464799 isoform X1 [Anopheles albimanus]|uniref:uncharacterized protein LOC118464799 isoform X1 n=1 Tax=Anopheles albimanus TaxID=7167 RepID=UPI0016405371|nr:uncharacterized protein LOC118464799 isoform X1 [Anopheles albimanus]
MSVLDTVLSSKQRAKLSGAVYEGAMSSFENRNSIGVLPEEVLSEIFKWLDVKSVKSASLVCRQWNQIIFSNHNIQRFCLVPDTNILNAIIRDILGENWHAYSKWSHRKRKHFRRTVQREEIQRIVQSQRCYRSLSWRRNKDNVELYLLKSLHPWKTQHLHTLTVDIAYCECIKEMLKLFNSVIRRLPQLHSLALLGEQTSEQEEKPWVELHSKTVRNLVLTTALPAVFEMPALQTLTTAHPTIHQIAYNFPLENLKELTFKNPLNSLEHFGFEPDIDVYRRMANLETLRYNDDIKEEEFLAVCLNCTMLKELAIMCKLPISQQKVFNHLTKLTNLRRLSLQDIAMPGTVICDFVKLSKLEYLHLGNESVENNLVLNLPQSITSVKLEITPQNERSLMRAITSSLTELKMLSIHIPNDNDYVDDHAPVVTLRLLPLLASLEVVEFSGGCFSKSCLLNMSTPMPRLRKLSFIQSMLGARNLKGLDDKFPKLKALEFRRCRIKSGDDIVNEYHCY